MPLGYKKINVKLYRSREQRPSGRRVLTITEIDLLTDLPGWRIRPLEAVTDLLNAEADNNAANGARYGREADLKFTRKKLTHVHDEGSVKTEGNQMNAAHECSIFKLVRCILISLQIPLYICCYVTLVRSVSNLIYVTRPPQLSTKSSSVTSLLLTSWTFYK